MEYGDLRRAMVEGTVDIALAVDVKPEVSRNYRSTLLYSDCLFAVMSKDNPLRHRSEGIDLDEIPQDKLLMPDSFAYAGLSTFIENIIESDTQVIAREYYRDFDMLSLKVLTEGYIALSSGLNMEMLAGRFAVLPVKGTDASFKVRAFYSDGLAQDLFDACNAQFEACAKLIHPYDQDNRGEGKTFTAAGWQQKTTKI